MRSSLASYTEEEAGVGVESGLRGGGWNGASLKLQTSQQSPPYTLPPQPQNSCEGER